MAIEKRTVISVLCGSFLLIPYIYVQLIDHPFFVNIPPLPDGFIIPEPMTIKWPNWDLNFQSIQGSKKMATYWWHPQGEPKALVFIFPGYADHSENNANIAQQLVENGYSAFGIDPIGHGRSEGLRGLIENFTASIEDCIRWTRHVRSQYPSHYKAFLWGGSMGGAMVLHILLKTEREFDGAFMSAPAIKASDDLYPLLRKLARFAADWFPTVPIAPALNDKVPSCLDERINIAIKSDPLFYNGRIRPKTAVEYLDNFEYLMANLERIDEPFFVFHGEKDAVIKYEDSSKLLLERASSKDKTVKLLPGERHNFLQSFKCKEYIKEVIQWYDEHL